MKKKEEILKIDRYQDKIISVAYPPDGKFIAIGSENEIVRICNVSDG